MNRGQMRDMLRGRLQEITPTQWTNAKLNELLDHGVQYVHRQVMKLHPEDVIYVAQAPLTINVTKYRKPSNMQFETSIGIKGSAGATTYAELDLVGMKEIRESDQGIIAFDDPSYAHHGRYFDIRPKPTATIAAGIQIEYVPILSMSDDTDVCDLRVDIHIGAVFYAHVLALADTDEDSAKPKEDLRDFLADLALTYCASGKKKHVNLGDLPRNIIE